MNILLAEQMRIAMQCNQTANQQCHMMMMMFPWMYWMPQPRNTNDKQTDSGR